MCIRSDRIHFGRAIFTTDLVEMTCRVIYVRDHTLEVEIFVHVVPFGSATKHYSHSAYFKFIHFDDEGKKRHISTGLKLDDTTPQEDLQRYLRARRRFEFWKLNERAFKSPFDLVALVHTPQSRSLI